MSVLKRDPIWGLCFLFKNSGLTHRWHQKPEQKIFPSELNKDGLLGNKEAQV